MRAEEREAECEREHYIMSWVTPVDTAGTLLFGPAPHGFRDSWYLARVCGVTCVVDLRPDARFTAIAKHYAERDVHTVSLPTDASAWVARGRLKDDKQLDLARQYVAAAKRALPHVRAARVSYVCGDEAPYIAFALQALQDASSAPLKPSVWLREQAHGTVLEDNRERIALLDAVWQEARRAARQERMFAPKRVPPTEAEPRRAPPMEAEPQWVPPTEAEPRRAPPMEAEPKRVRTKLAEAFISEAPQQPRPE